MSAASREVPGISIEISWKIEGHQDVLSWWKIRGIYIYMDNNGLVITMRVT